MLQVGRRAALVLACVCLVVVTPVVGSPAQGRVDACAGPPSPVLSGVFVRPDVGPAQGGEWWSEADWRATVAAMRELCLTDVILQWSAQTWSGDGPPRGVSDRDWPTEKAPACVAKDAEGLHVQPLYAAADPVWVRNARHGRDGDCTRTRAQVDQVRHLLSVAKTAGMRVWLGLQIDEPVWFDRGNDDPEWMRAQTALSVRIAGDLWRAYGPDGAVGDYSATIAGFYLPFEPDNQFFPPGERRTRLLGDHLSEVSRAIHGLPGGRELGVLTAPVQHTQIGAAPDEPEQRELRTAWTETLRGWLAESEVTVVAPQSGTGMQWSGTADLGPWARAARDAIDALPGKVNAAGAPVRLWGDIEVYAIHGLGVHPVDQVVADMVAFDSAGARADRFVAFSLRSLDPTAGHPDAALNSLFHSAHRHYATSGVVPRQRVGAPPPAGGARLTGELDGTGFGARLRWRPVAPSDVLPSPGHPDVPVHGVAGYAVRRDGVLIAHVPQPFTDERDAHGLPVPDLTGELGFIDEGLEPGTSYDYEVAAVDPFGTTSPWTGTATVTVPHRPGAESVDRGARVRVRSVLAEDGGVLGSRASAASALVDGIVGTAQHLDPAWSPTVSGTVEVDLGRPRAVGSVRSAWLNDSRGGVSVPPVVAEYLAGDRWLLLGHHRDAVPPGDPGITWSTSSLPPGELVVARKVRLRLAEGASGRVSEVDVRGPDGRANLARTARMAPTAEPEPVAALDPLVAAWCAPVSATCPETGGVPDDRISLTVDLGADQPIGSVSTVWHRRRGLVVPTGITYATRAEGGQWSPAQATREERSGVFTAQVPGTRARWVRLDAQVPPDGGWLALRSVDVRTPSTSAATKGGTPAVHVTGSTLNDAYRPDLPVDPEQNNPTVTQPGGLPPAVACVKAPASGPCRGTDDLLATVLTALNPTTGRPYRGDPERWWDSGSHWLGLGDGPGFDIVVPTGETVVSDLSARFLHAERGAIALPATVDFYYATTPGGPWIWAPHTAVRPALPPYLPERATPTATYRATIPPTRVAAVRMHVNPTRGDHVFLDHFGAGSW